MDYNRLNDLLDEETYYENMKKTAFIYRKMLLFKKFKKKAYTQLKFSANILLVLELTGINSGHKYDIYIQFTECEITDIF
ncbi:hypothetical protein GCM10007962_08730 [Yeosuana aromativorans]|jgi:hypothetical protein|uniref:Uncharacterized protein n=1 Tax=Yeosuana aromativorans TaxID=288019 RepID=A0A8J3BII5_9FLAO|nr:hypothetical protein [Yeosuana aromativorans]GGK16698.1 hypothetical protein GCM10007962_08730 [Yeosuana aromativorans]